MNKFAIVLITNKSQNYFNKRGEIVNSQAPHPQPILLRPIRIIIISKKEPACANCKNSTPQPSITPTPKLSNPALTQTAPSAPSMATSLSYSAPTPSSSPSAPTVTPPLFRYLLPHHNRCLLDPLLLHGLAGVCSFGESMAESYDAGRGDIPALLILLGGPLQPRSHNSGRFPDRPS